MTYLFKLVRRLAISRHPAAFAALVLFTACDGDTTAPDSQGASPVDTPVSLQVSPRSVTIETSQQVRFRGQTRTLRGEPVETPLVWRASGGTIQPDGSFLSPTAGTFQIFARGRGWKHTDTAVVRVVLPQPGLARITVSPKTVTMEPGGTHAFSAEAFLARGSATQVGVNWSATGGTVDPSGVYMADSIAGVYQVVASNTAGTIADTADVTVGSSSSPPTPEPTPTPTPPPPAGPPTAPGHMQVILSPARSSLTAGGRQQYSAYGRTRAGNRVAVGVAYRVTGGTITPAGLYTAGQKMGTYKVIATSNGISDTALVTLTSSPAPVPLPTPTPVPPPIYTGKMGIPVGVSNLLSAGVNPASYTMSLDSYTAEGIVRRLVEARSKRLHVMLNLTGGAHSNYMTGGRFDMAKWEAKMDSYNTASIKQAVAAAVADGTIVGNSVMDEPANITPKSNWGPPGTMTKARVDQMCGYVKRLFPTMPVGVVHDHRVLEPEKNYQTCDFIVSQYRMSKAPVNEFRDGGLAFARRSNIAIAFSLNILHGGTPGTSCAKYGDDENGMLCPMSAEQVRSWGITLGSAGCALNMWRYERAYFNQPEIQAAVKAVAESLAKLPGKACVRS